MSNVLTTCCAAFTRPFNRCATALSNRIRLLRAGPPRTQSAPSDPGASSAAATQRRSSVPLSLSALLRNADAGANGVGRANPDGTSSADNSVRAAHETTGTVIVHTDLAAPVRIVVSGAPDLRQPGPLPRSRSFSSRARAALASPRGSISAEGPSSRSGALKACLRSPSEQVKFMAFSRRDFSLENAQLLVFAEGLWEARAAGTCAENIPRLRLALENILPLLENKALNLDEGEKAALQAAGATVAQPDARIADFHNLFTLLDPAISKIERMVSRDSFSRYLKDEAAAESLRTTLRGTQTYKALLNAMAEGHNGNLAGLAKRCARLQALLAEALNSVFMMDGRDIKKLVNEMVGTYVGVDAEYSVHGIAQGVRDAFLEAAAQPEGANAWSPNRDALTRLFHELQLLEAEVHRLLKADRNFQAFMASLSPASSGRRHDPGSSSSSGEPAVQLHLQVPAAVSPRSSVSTPSGTDAPSRSPSPESARSGKASDGSKSDSPERSPR